MSARSLLSISRRGWPETLALLAVLLTAQHFPVSADDPVRFTFKFEPNTPLKDLLPAPPKTPLFSPSLLQEDLARVPEVAFGEPISSKLDTHKTMEQTAHILAKINHLNRKHTDAFMEALLEQRADLRGLPFRMGKDCRTELHQAKLFAIVVGIVNEARQLKRNDIRVTKEREWAESFAEILRNLRGALAKYAPDDVERTLVAALMQMLTLESADYRVSLARFLAKLPHVDAAHALAKLALFAPEETVRAAAVEGLKRHRSQEYGEVLMSGFKYPLPVVASRAAETLVKLERKDLLPRVVDILEQPDPRAPSQQKIAGKDVSVVREVVRLNHHRNCMLCHAPATDNLPPGVLTAGVPLPNAALPSPSEGGYRKNTSPDLLVRLDVTYLRQDFSMMMPVADAKPWPTMQRFDFFVRTRVLTSEEAKACQAQLEERTASEMPPHQRAALFALRELTGRDAESTAAAWRRVMKLP